jgi:hypothetical protein
MIPVLLQAADESAVPAAVRRQKRREPKPLRSQLILDSLRDGITPVQQGTRKAKEAGRRLPNSTAAAAVKAAPAAAAQPKKKRRRQQQGELLAAKNVLLHTLVKLLDLYSVSPAVTPRRLPWQCVLPCCALWCFACAATRQQPLYPSTTHNLRQACCVGAASLKHHYRFNNRHWGRWGNSSSTLAIYKFHSRHTCCLAAALLPRPCRSSNRHLGR